MLVHDAVGCLASAAFNAPLPHWPGVCIAAVMATVKILLADTSLHYHLSHVHSFTPLQQRKEASLSLPGIILGSDYVQPEVPCNTAMWYRASADPAQPTRDGAVAGKGSAHAAQGSRARHSSHGNAHLRVSLCHDLNWCEHIWMGHVKPSQ